MLHKESDSMRFTVRALLAALLIGASSVLAAPEEGKPAPAFDAPATSITSVLPDAKDAKTLSLKQFEGKKNVVLFFFPKAMTKG
jgi:cytochrome oxidase Cu insertion factor (SCO1/SenC/PrrC family)